jgi:hypothetical protein
MSSRVLGAVSVFGGVNVRRDFQSPSVVAWDGLYLAFVDALTWSRHGRVGGDDGLQVHEQAIAIAFEALIEIYACPMLAELKRRETFSAAYNVVYGDAL